MNQVFWKGKRVFITGHTGFKGAWLCEWLLMAGAVPCGYSLGPSTKPSLFAQLGLDGRMESVIADIRDERRLQVEMERFGAEIAFHLAAQSLVKRSFEAPVETFSTNVQGTVNFLEAARRTDALKAAVVVTSDKCYRLEKGQAPRKEGDPLGGSDPYSTSKACAELAVASYRESFFSDSSSHAVAVATARAGNVIGGGDWADNRLIPDVIRASFEKKTVLLRNPDAIRPWQHVLDPLAGYLLLAEKLHVSGKRFAKSWNFGPTGDGLPVKRVVEKMQELWGETGGWKTDEAGHPAESPELRLDSALAQKELGWKPRLDIVEALRWTIDWMRVYEKKGDLRAATLGQIRRYSEAA